MERPVTSIYLWFDVGAQDEPAGLEGAAHFVEHMIFKGTRSHGVGEVARSIEGMGGDLNAYTSHDATVLHATVASSSWEEAFKVLCEMAWHSTFDPEEVEREREVILEEIAGYDDDPGAVVQEAASEALFGEHAYGRPVLGSRASVTALTPTQLKSFWQNHYLPERTLVAFTGPIDPDRVASLVDTWTPRDREGAGRASRRPPEPRPPNVVTPERGFDTTVVQIAWRTPGIPDEDLAALDVLTAALGQGHGARASLELQLKRELVLDVWCEHQPLSQGGCWVLGMMPLPGKARPALEHALALVEEVRVRGLTGREVQRARDSLLADMLFAEETTDGVAHDLVWFTANHGTPDARARWRSALAAVTPERVQQVARRWLKADQKVVAGTGPQAEALRAVKSPPARSPLPRSESLEPEVFELGEGVRLAAWPDDRPVAAIRVTSLGGQLLDRAHTAGRGVAWAQTVTSGAGTMDEGALAREVDALGGVLSPFVAKAQLGLSLSLPSAHVGDGLDLLKTLIVEPHFNPDSWSRVRNELLESLRTVKDRPAQLAREHAWSALWPDHPWRLPPGGTERSLCKLKPITLRRTHHASLCKPGLLVSIAGGFDRERVAEGVAAWLPSLPEGKPFVAPSEPTAPRTGTQRLDAGHHQALLTWSVRAPALSEETYHPLQIALSILGGQSGRLFHSLREDLGLAYSVWAHAVSSPFGGVATAGLATAIDKREQARDALEDALDTFARSGPTHDEVDRCRRMMLGHTAMRLQGCGGRAAALSNATLYGVPLSLQVYTQLLDQIGPDDVRSAFADSWSQGGIWVEVAPS